MGLIFVGRGGKDEEWCVFGFFSPQISETYFLGVGVFWTSFSMGIFQELRGASFTGCADMHVE